MWWIPVPERHHREKSLFLSVYRHSAASDESEAKKIRSEMKSFFFSLDVEERQTQLGSSVCAQGNAPDDDLWLGEITRFALQPSSSSILPRTSDYRLRSISESDSNGESQFFRVFCRVYFRCLQRLKSPARTVTRKIFLLNFDKFSATIFIKKSPWEMIFPNETFTTPRDKWICRSSKTSQHRHDFVIYASAFLWWIRRGCEWQFEVLATCRKSSFCCSRLDWFLKYLGQSLSVVSVDANRLQKIDFKGRRRRIRSFFWCRNYKEKLIRFNPGNHQQTFSINQSLFFRKPHSTSFLKPPQKFYDSTENHFSWRHWNHQALRRGTSGEEMCF